MGLTVALGAVVEDPSSYFSLSVDGVRAAALWVAMGGWRGPAGMVVFGTVAGLAGSLVSPPRDEAHVCSTLCSAPRSSVPCTARRTGACSPTTRTRRAPAPPASSLSDRVSTCSPTRRSTPSVAPSWRAWGGGWPVGRVVHGDALEGAAAAMLCVSLSRIARLCTPELLVWQFPSFTDQALTTSASLYSMRRT